MTAALDDRASLEELARAFDVAPEEVDLSSYAIEDWVACAAYWIVVACVILQFFTRYVLNDSFAWTEELASAGLVSFVFLGAVMCVRRDSHIRIDLLQRLLPPSAGRLLGLVVDLATVLFLAYMTWLTWRYLSVVGGQRMITVDLPRVWLYYAVLCGFALMALRLVVRLIANLKGGSMPLADDNR